MLHSPSIYVSWVAYGDSMSRKASWDVLVDRFKSNLSTWKVKFLSSGCLLDHEMLYNDE